MSATKRSAFALAAVTIVYFSEGEYSEVVAGTIGEEQIRTCISEIFHQTPAPCADYFNVGTIKKVDARTGDNEAFAIADVDFRIKKRMEAGSSGVSYCTGRGWTVPKPKNPYPDNTAQWLMWQSQTDMAGGYLEPGQTLRIRKKFRFEHWESGWRCAERTMNPVDQGWFIGEVGSATPGERSPMVKSTTGVLSLSAGADRTILFEKFREAMLKAEYRIDFAAADKGTIRATRTLNDSTFYWNTQIESASTGLTVTMVRGSSNTNAALDDVAALFEYVLLQAGIDTETALLTWKDQTKSVKKWKS